MALAGWDSIKSYLITLDESRTGETLTDFPALINLTGIIGKKVFDEVGDNNLKIAIEDIATGNQCYVEIVRWVGTGISATGLTGVDGVNGTVLASSEYNTSYYDQYAWNDSVTSPDSAGTRWLSAIGTFNTTTGVAIGSTWYQWDWGSGNTGTVTKLRHYNGTQPQNGIAQCTAYTSDTGAFGGEETNCGVLTFTQGSNTNWNDFDDVPTPTDARYFRIVIDSIFTTNMGYTVIPNFELGMDVAEDNNAQAYVKVPSYSDTEPTKLRLYYDNDQADNTTYIGVSGSTPAQSVWDSDFVAVYHLASVGDIGTDSIIDSTSGAYHGTPQKDIRLNSIVDSDVGKGLHITRTSYILCGTPTTIWDDGMTLEAMVYPDDATTDYIMSYGVADYQTVLMSTRTNILIASTTGSSWDILNGTPYPEPEEWSYLVGILDGTNAITALNDQTNALSNLDGTPTVTDHTIQLGTHYSQHASYWMNGSIREARFSKTPRSASWRVATYYSNIDELVSITYDIPDTYAWMTDQTVASHAEIFQRIRDFLCKRNGTYDYSTTGIGWLLIDSSYATDEDTLTDGDWCVIKSDGKNGNEMLYYRLEYDSAGFIFAKGYLSWNTTTHTGGTISYFRSSAYLWNSDAVTKLWIWGDINYVHMVGYNGTTWTTMGFLGCLDTPQFDRKIEICNEALTAGTNVVIPLADTNNGHWQRKWYLFITDGNKFERIYVSANDGTSITATLVNSYGAGAHISQNFPYLVQSREAYWYSNSYYYTVHDGAGVTPHNCTGPYQTTTIQNLADPGPINSMYIAMPGWILVNGDLDIIGTIPNMQMLSVTGFVHNTVLTTTTSGTGVSVQNWRTMSVNAQEVAFKESNDG